MMKKAEYILFNFVAIGSSQELWRRKWKLIWNSALTGPSPSKIRSEDKSPVKGATSGLPGKLSPGIRAVEEQRLKQKQAEGIIVAKFLPA